MVKIKYLQENWPSPLSEIVIVEKLNKILLDDHCETLVRIFWSLQNYTNFLFSLLDKVVSRNQWHIAVQEHHLMFKDPYMVTKKKVCLE